MLSIQCGRALLGMVQRRMAGKDDRSTVDSAQNYVIAFDPFGDYETPNESEEVLFSDPAVLLEFFERR